MILQFEESRSVVTQILQFEEKNQKNSPGAKRPDKLIVNAAASAIEATAYLCSV